MRASILIALSFALGCRAQVDKPTPLDNDADGYLAEDDCDDANPLVHPDADELCDGLDNDCDEAIDEEATDAFTWWPDVDQDGFGAEGEGLLACEVPAGYVSRTGDCDDHDDRFHPGATESDCADPSDYNCDGSVGYQDQDGDGYPACQDCRDNDDSIHPAADEVCDLIDNDCDGTVDEADAIDAVPWYADQDGDGFGDPANTVDACLEPEGYLADDGDCDDSDPQVNPVAREVCDGADNDCDAAIDEEAVDADNWFLDDDGDGYGNPAEALVQCEAPEGYTYNSQDCDDGDERVHPEADETCNAIDDNCDGDVDDDPIDPSTWYGDADGDGAPGASYTRESCERPEGFAAEPTDCDDADDTIYPGAPELCDGLINDCDASELPDEEADADGDGVAACDGDCDDSRDDVSPLAPERCDDADNDCDGLNNEADAVGAPTWYADADDDGFGGPRALAACDMPPGYAATYTDCDDLDPSTYPGAPELCDGLINDCDASELPSEEADADGDGVAACDGDCDDSRDDVSPLAPERCDGVDNDCDTRTDEGDAIDPATWYMDGDGDGYGGSRTAEACAAPTGYVGDSTDCDDTDRHTYPGAPERCDRVMNDCDAAGLPDDEADLDSDGVTACEGDCGDDPAAGGASIGPHLPERCDGVDNDCDLAVDEADAVDAQTWYADADLDGYGGTTTTRACYVPSGYVGTPGDCEDLILAIHPGVDEVCDGLDNDCDGVADNRDAVLGTAAACPARHCADVLENVDDASDGAYWVDSIGSTAPYLAYCDMSTEGGGWTLALKADGTQPTFSYDAAYWTNTSLLNPTSADLSHTQAKLEPFLSMPFSEVMAGIAYPIDTSGDLFLTTLVLPQGGSSLRSLFSGGYVATTQGRAAWKGLMAGSSLQPNCNKEGFNVYHSYSRVRVGIYANQEGDCGSPDSRLGIGGQGSTCGQLDGLSVGNAAGCSPDLGDKNLYAWGALFLRCDLDAPDDYGDGLDTNCDGVDGQDLDGDGQPSLASGGPDCDDTDPDVHLGAGCVLAASCLEEADAGASIDGLYTLEPVPGRWVRAWCDMSGGGWTLAFYKNSPHTTPIFSTPGGYAFGADFVATDALAGDPAARSASTTPWAGWLDILGTDATHLRLGAYAAGAETYLSDPIALSELNVDFGQSGYLLYDAPSDPVRSDGLTYYWCGGDASFTDAGVGQVNQPVGAPADCKGHGSVGSGWDFSRANTPNQGLTLCGGDASAWMDGSWAGDRQTFPTPGAAQAIWIR